MSIHSSVTQLQKMLGNLDRWLETAIAHAKTKSFDPNVLASARLAPDQYPLARQVQAACDAAKFAAVRLTGKEAPANPDTETTMDELRARVASVIAIIGTYSEADFTGCETREIALPFLPGKVLLGEDFLNQMSIPNFYFHLGHAYAILRHNGVALGKMDYIGGLTLRDPS